MSKECSNIIRAKYQFPNFCNYEKIFSNEITLIRRGHSTDAGKRTCLDIKHDKRTSRFHLEYVSCRDLMAVMAVLTFSCQIKDKSFPHKMTKTV